MGLNRKWTVASERFEGFPSPVLGPEGEMAPAIVMVFEFHAAFFAVELDDDFVRGLKLIEIIADDRAGLAAGND